MRNEPGDLRRAGARLAHVRLDLLSGMPESEGLRLGETVLQGQILRIGTTPRAAQGRDEIQRRGRRALMQHLKERMLRVRARLAPDHGRRREVDPLATQGYR